MDGYRSVSSVELTKGQSLKAPHAGLRVSIVVVSSKADISSPHRPRGSLPFDHHLHIGHEMEKKNDFAKQVTFRVV